MGNKFRKNYKKLIGAEPAPVNPDMLVDREDIGIFAGSSGVSSYTVMQNAKKFYTVDQAGSSLVLPTSPRLWQEHVVKDNSGQASLNPIIVYGSGVNIDDASSAQIGSDWGSLSLIFNGTQWNLI